ncbi:MAG: hypothetical protein PHZ24_06400 [Bacteroidales bacterium]|nr:hypothetical protein [Bacteroidales bacterium]MDY0140737.1 hypothetical protein [Bacteroidales bacterium]
MKRIMTTILIFIGFCSVVCSQKLPNDSIKSYVDFLSSKTFLSPKEYVLKSFEEKDIIVLCERLHPEFKQYEMIVEIIKDKRFTGNVYTEVGVFNVGQQINEFLLKENLSTIEIKEHLLSIFRNLDMFSLWPNYNYYYLIESIYQINQQRQLNEKIRLIPLDLMFSWDSIKCNEQYIMFLDMMEPQNNLPPVIDRNTIMAQQFIRKYDQEKYNAPNKKKALVIMNTYHAYTRTPKYLIHPTEPITYSAAEYIYKTFPNSTKGILINGITNSWELVANGKWDASFKYTGNKKLGFDLKDTPFGKTKFDMYNFGGNAYETVNFEYIFDGLVFYEPIENFECVVGIPGIFDDKTFVIEFYRRTSIEEKITIEESMSSEDTREYIEDWNVKKVDKISSLEKFNALIHRWMTR